MIQNLLIALSKVPPETYLALAKAIEGVAMAADPLDAAQRLAEEMARVEAADRALIGLKG